MKRSLFIGIALAVLFLFVTTTSQAITIGFDPISQDVPVGDTVDVALVISGLEYYTAPSVGVFDLDIAYDPTIVAFTGYALGPYLGDIWLGEAVDWSLGEVSAGSVNIYELSLLYANQASDPFYDPNVPGSGFPPYLDDIQPSSFTLATLTFDTLAVGTSSLDITAIYALGDAYGNPLTLDEVQSGSISPVPEPTTLLLLGSGLAGIFGLGRKRWFKS